MKPCHLGSVFLLITTLSLCQVVKSSTTVIKPIDHDDDDKIERKEISSSAIVLPSLDGEAESKFEMTPRKSDEDLTTEVGDDENLSGDFLFHLDEIDGVEGRGMEGHSSGGKKKKPVKRKKPKNKKPKQKKKKDKKEKESSEEESSEEKGGWGPPKKEEPKGWGPPPKEMKGWGEPPKMEMKGWGQSQGQGQGQQGGQQQGWGMPMQQKQPWGMPQTQTQQMGWGSQQPQQPQQMTGWGQSQGQGQQQGQQGWGQMQMQKGQQQNQGWGSSQQQQKPMPNANKYGNDLIHISSPSGISKVFRTLKNLIWRFFSDSIAFFMRLFKPDLDHWSKLNVKNINVADSIHLKSPSSGGHGGW